MRGNRGGSGKLKRGKGGCVGSSTTRRERGERGDYLAPKEVWEWEDDEKRRGREIPVQSSQEHQRRDQGSRVKGRRRTWDELR
jgi:hypothetical protein